MKTNVQNYARLAGFLLLVTMAAGIFGELYVPSRLVVAGDATATARNITSGDFLFRLGFASYLVEAVCDVTLILAFYVLLKPADRNLALLSAFFGLISTALYAVAELSYFSAGIILRSSSLLKSFSPDQIREMAMLTLKLFGSAGGIFMVFYGIASVLRGYLIFRSRYLPCFLGVILMTAGLGFIAKSVTLVLLPSMASDVLLLPTFIAIVSLAGWFLIKGVDVERWEQAAKGRSPHSPG